MLQLQGHLKMVKVDYHPQTHIEEEAVLNYYRKEGAHYLEET